MCRIDLLWETLGRRFTCFCIGLLSRLGESWSLHSPVDSEITLFPEMGRKGDLTGEAFVSVMERMVLWKDNGKVFKTIRCHYRIRQNVNTRGKRRTIIGDNKPECLT